MSTKTRTQRDVNKTLNNLTYNLNFDLPGRMVLNPDTAGYILPDWKLIPSPNGNSKDISFIPALKRRIFLAIPELWILLIIGR